MATEIDQPITMRVGDLTDEHRGIYGYVHDEERVTGKRWLQIDSLRRWTYNGVDRVGITEKAERGSPWSGTEYHFTADQDITLVRRVRTIRAKRKATS